MRWLVGLTLLLGLGCATSVVPCVDSVELGLHGGLSGFSDHRREPYVGGSVTLTYDPQDFYCENTPDGDL